MTIQPAQIAPHRLDLPREPWSLRDVSVLEINLTNLDHNMKVLRRVVGKDCWLCPIVKADAYGLGAARVGKRLAYAGADMLAVYTPEQAGELLKTAVGCPILVLMPVRDIARVDEIYRGLIADKVHLTVHDLPHVADLVAITDKYGLTMNVHLEIDTGMSRGGCSVADAPKVLERIAACRRMRLAGVFTHFANAEGNVQFTNQQMQTFERLLREQARHIPATCRVHAANTFATIRGKPYHKSMVRIGLGWAGCGVECMSDGEVIAEASELRPILAWKSRIVQIKAIEPGTPVGYGSKWTAKRRTILGLVPVGYADGYPTTLGSRDELPMSKGAAVAVFDRAAANASEEHGGLLGYAPVVGAINMDQLSIDMTDVLARRSGGANAGASGAISPEAMAAMTGGIVEVISPDVNAPNHLTTLAKMAGTIPHELLTRLSQRIPRLYVAPLIAAEHIAHGAHAARKEKALVV